jgi:hypothetical protein
MEIAANCGIYYWQCGDQPQQAYAINQCSQNLLLALIFEIRVKTKSF